MVADKLLLVSLIVYFNIITLTAVTVNPALCPTNKIAPHKRVANWNRGRGRTLGAFYELLAPNNNNYYNHQYDPPNDLQETPQEDDPDDCGDIDDYDENDLSSITPEAQRRKETKGDRTFGFFVSSGSGNRPQRPPNPPSNPPYPNRPPYGPPGPPYPGPPNPDIPPFAGPSYPGPSYPGPSYPGPSYPDGRPPGNRPPRPDRPPYPDRPPGNRPPYTDNRPPSSNRPPNSGGSYPPTRPPYWSGGFFGSNEYRPPPLHSPSDDIKPIHEYTDNNHVTYRPSVVGALLGQVVGVPARPPNDDFQTTTSSVYPYRGQKPPRRPHDTQPTPRPSRPRNLNSNTILGSFVDLLFK